MGAFEAASSWLRERFALGSAAAPSITFAGDTNTGLYSPGADQVGIATAGSAAVTVDASQRVGIGTAVPTARLQTRVDLDATKNLWVERQSDNAPSEMTLYRTRASGADIAFNDQIGEVTFAAQTGGAAATFASIRAYVDAAPGSADAPGRLTFHTAADGSTVQTLRLGISNSGQLTVGTGSATAPVVSFFGDTNTGIYSPGADQVGIATAGTARVTIDASGNVSLPSTTSIGSVSATEIGYVDGVTSAIQTQIDGKAPTASPTFTGVISNALGTVTAPSYTFTGDLNTGVYSPGADQVAIATAGTARVVVSSAGLLTGTGDSLGAWTAYTPTLAANGGWAIGNGSISGRYCQVGKIVVCKLYLTFGSTSTFFASQIQISIPPVSAATSLSVDYGNHVVFFDASASSQYLGNAQLSGSNFVLRNNASPSVVATSTVPFTFASSDTIFIAYIYEAA